MWTLAHIVKLLTLFFANPSELYVKYIRTLENPNIDAVERYQKSAIFWISGIASSLANFFLFLSFSLIILYWAQISSLIAV